MRLTAYYKLVPEPKSYREAVATAISVMRVAQVPFRDPRKEEALDTGESSDADRLWYGVQTNWLSAIDVTHKVYYLNSCISPDLFWVELKDLDLKPGAPVLYLDPHNIELGGNIAGKFELRKAAIR